MRQIPKRWLLTGGFVILLLVGSLVLWRQREQRKVHPLTPIFPSSLLNQPFPVPATDLVDLNGDKLKDSEMRTGKVVLVLLSEGCGPCIEEGKFLGSLGETRSDVRFYGIMPFGKDHTSLKSAVSRFPFKLYFDEGGSVVQALHLDKLPIKLYLQDGVLKKGWGGASFDSARQTDFKHWLESV